MRFASIFPLVFLLTVFWTAFANAESAQPAPDANFNTGVAAFQKGDLKKSRAAFAEVLKANPHNSLVLFDLGLVEQKSGNLGMAMGLWRKALAVDPEYHAASQALAWAQMRQEHAEIPHEVELWESFRKSALVPVSVDKYLVATLLLLLVSGWLLMRYFGRRRQARLDEKPMPGFPVAATIASILFLAALFCALAKVFDMSEIRGTILPKKIEARSSPDESATPLFELYEGLEVIVRNSNQSSGGEWAQVTYPGGSTGWIPRSAVFTTQDSVKVAQ